MAEVLGAKAVEGKDSSRRLHILRPPWSIYVGTTVVSTGSATVTLTQARALVHCRDVRIRVRRTNAFARWLRRRFGREGQVGSPPFRRTFWVRCADRNLARVVLDAKVEALLMEDRALTLRVAPALRKERKRSGEATRAITVSAMGVILDPARLQRMTTLVAEVADRLARGAGATPTPEPLATA